MNTSRISLAVAAAAVLVLAVPAQAEEAVRPASESGRSLSIPQIYQKLTALGYWNIDKIEREARAYEVRANEPSGDRVKLYLDARSGEIVETRRGRRHRSHEERQRWRGSPDCNERRCRDDLPAKAPSAAPDGR